MVHDVLESYIHEQRLVYNKFYSHLLYSLDKKNDPDLPVLQSIQPLHLLLGTSSVCRVLLWAYCLKHLGVCLPRTSNATKTVSHGTFELQAASRYFVPCVCVVLSLDCCILYWLCWSLVRFLDLSLFCYRIGLLHCEVSHLTFIFRLKTVRLQIFLYIQIYW